MGLGIIHDTLQATPSEIYPGIFQLTKNQSVVSIQKILLDNTIWLKWWTRVELNEFCAIT